MNKQKLILSGLASMLGLFAYVTLIGFIMNHAERWFGNTKGLLAPTIFLMLFIFSALVTGSTVLGYPVWLYFEGRKKESLWAFVSVVTWLFIALVVLLSWRIAVNH